MAASVCALDRWRAGVRRRRLHLALLVVFGLVLALTPRDTAGSPEAPAPIAAAERDNDAVPWAPCARTLELTNPE